MSAGNSFTISGLQDDYDDVIDDIPEFVSPPPEQSDALSSRVAGLSLREEKSESRSPVTTPTATKYGGGGDVCPRCKSTVYFAEAREGPDSIKYHKLCFVCAICKKLLDSTYSVRQGELFCKSCYGKEFGPKGFGVGSSLPTSSPTSASSPSITTGRAWAPSANETPSPSNKLASKFGGGEKCPRCNKTVYLAEAREGPNMIKYHKTCFVCLLCSKSLDSRFTERRGELYCQKCYAKEFGPKGFGITGVTSEPIE
uniref:LIM zinc-binding domain-containing protein n=1 Tax=Guillardia theta TaxID=55529 RepID=A0A6U6B4H4_GUITH|mmetsp:Transcript_35060/g.109561  ORF Transcript_35060/g.109561 Transcript_35060/m.109561 type:complete len:255 (+) Transcript_35060:48-812(+)